MLGYVTLLEVISSGHSHITVITCRKPVLSSTQQDKLHLRTRVQISVSLWVLLFPTSNLLHSFSATNLTCGLNEMLHSNTQFWLRETICQGGLSLLPHDECCRGQLASTKLLL